MLPVNLGQIGPIATEMIATAVAIWTYVDRLVHPDLGRMVAPSRLSAPDQTHRFFRLRKAIFDKSPSRFSFSSTNYFRKLQGMSHLGSCHGVLNGALDVGILRLWGVVPFVLRHWVGCKGHHSTLGVSYVVLRHSQLNQQTVLEPEHLAHCYFTTTKRESFA